MISILRTLHLQRISTKHLVSDEVKPARVIRLAAYRIQ